eukprot:COSAG06_NODE_874_length_11831_cov_217.383396_7_plen_611_part_00
MSKCGSGKSSKGGSSKGSSGSIAESVSRSKALQTPTEKLVSLRAALRDDSGLRDRDVAADLLPALLAYNKNELDVSIKFFTGSTLTKELRQFMFRLARKNTKAISDASGYGWDDDEYKEALKAPEERYLVAFAAETESAAAAPVGFMDFQFVLQGVLVDEMEGDTCLLVQDLQLQKAVQRKGLGRHMLSLAQLIAKKQGMSTIATKVFVNDKAAQAFMETQMPGFAVSYEFVPEGEPLEVWEKSLAAGAPKAAPPAKPLLATPSKAGPSTASASAKEEAVSPPTSPDAAEAVAEPTASAPMTAAEKKKARKKAQKARKKAAEKAAASEAKGEASAVAGNPTAASGAAVEQQFSAASLGEAFKLQLQSPEELQAATLSAFYAHVKVEKSAAEVEEILSKRREAGKLGWFEALCAKLEKKYGVSPSEAYKQSQLPTTQQQQEQQAAGGGVADTPRPRTPAVPAPTAAAAGTAAAPVQLEPEITVQEVTSLVTSLIADPAAGAEGGAEEEEPADEVDVLLEELMDLFKQQNVSPSSTLVSPSCLLLICTVWLLASLSPRCRGGILRMRKSSSGWIHSRRSTKSRSRAAATLTESGLVWTGLGSFSGVVTYSGI